MRLICPNCDAQYEIDGALVPVKGRDVECSACGQVWFQPGATVAAPASLGVAGAGGPVLSRPLSDSVLSILREEASRELRNRKVERDGALPPASTGPESPAPSHAPSFDPSQSPKVEPGALDLPLVDWPATTVADLDQTVRTGARQTRIEVPPLTLPDAEKLAATLAPRPSADTGASKPGKPDILAEDAQDEMSLPGDATLDPSEGAELWAPDKVTSDSFALDAFNTDAHDPEGFSPEVELTDSDPISDLAKEDQTDAGLASGLASDAKSDGAKPLETSLDTAEPTASAPVATEALASAPLTSASETSQSAPPAPTETAPTKTAPTEAHLADAPAAEPALDPKRDQLPSTVVIAQQQIEARAGYRTGFGIAAMVAALVIGGYFLAPRLAGQGELGAKLMEWRQDADRGRVWLYEQANGLLGRE